MREQLQRLPTNTHVFFTAHSLPERVLLDDPYPEQLLASAEAIAERAGLASSNQASSNQASSNRTWSIGWQSAGRTPEPWRGPDILDCIKEVAANSSA